MGRSTSKIKTVKVVRSVQRRAKFVGILYFLANLILTLLSFVTFLTAPYSGKEIEFSTGVFNFSTGAVSAFWAPLLDGMSVYFIAAALYAVLLLILMVNLISSCIRLRELFRKYSKNERAATAAVELARINKKKYAMENLGRTFSGSFAGIVCLNLVIYLILPFVQMEIFAFVAIGLGVVVHLLCGILSAKVMEFNTASQCWCGQHHCGPANYPIYDPRMLASNGVDAYYENQVVNKQTLKLEKRTSGITVFFFRNLLQLLTVFGLTLAVANVTSLHIDVAHILGDTEVLQGLAPQYIEGYVVDYVTVAIQAVLLFALCMLITHVTSITEFNDLGMEGRGMKRFKFFSMLTLIGGAGYMVLQLAGGAASDAWIPVGFIVALAFLGFVVDCIVHPKDSGYGNLDDENKILFYSEEMEEQTSNYMRPRYRA